MSAEIVNGQVVEVPLKATAGYTRKRGLPNYSSEEASVYIQADIPLDADTTVVDTAVAVAFDTAKVRVLTELGIDFEYDNDGHVSETAPTVPPVVANAFPGAQVVQGSSTPSTPASPQSDDKTFSREELLAMWKSNPDLFFDNTEAKASGKYKATAPDAKLKSNKQALWLTSKFDK